MSEYIKREAVFEQFDNGEADVIEIYPDGSVDYGFGASNIRDLVNGIPAADVAPVIRCLDCKHWIAEGASRADNCVCLLASDAVLGEYHYTPPDGYCYKAERRKDCPPWLQEIKEAMQDG